jgi:hypothetical protein
MKHYRFWTVVLVILLGLTQSANAGEMVMHSGSIFSIGGDVTTFVLAEVGPWQIRDGETVVTYRTITLTPQTEYAVVARADAPTSGFPGDFVETPVGPENVYLNDYVTVECILEGKRLIARKITVTETSPAAASPR